MWRLDLIDHIDAYMTVCGSAFLDATGIGTREHCKTAKL